MKKIVFEGEENSLFISKNENEIKIEMIENGCNTWTLQIGDSYNHISLTKENAIDLANEILKLTKDEKE